MSRYQFALPLSLLQRGFTVAKNEIEQEGDQLIMVGYHGVTRRTTRISLTNRHLATVFGVRWRPYFEAATQTWYWTGSLNGHSVTLHSVLAGCAEGEEAHHRNGQTEDNLDENLEALPSTEHRAQRRGPNYSASEDIGEVGIVRQIVLRASGARETVLRASAVGPMGQCRKRFADNREGLDEAITWRKGIQDGILRGHPRRAKRFAFTAN
jgi:hypothetical protein